MIDRAEGRSVIGRAGRTALAFIAALACLIALLIFLATNSRPAVDAGPPPTAAQVGAGRDALLQLRARRDDPHYQQQIAFGPAELDGMSALATHGLQPDRLRMQLRRGDLSVAGSHRLFGGRWLNITVVVQGHSRGFPPVDLTIGHLRVRGWMARMLIEIGRLALRVRHVDVPPLDQLVHSVTVRDDRVIAEIQLPRKSGLIDQVVSLPPSSVDETLVVKIYCRLASQQRVAPVTELATHVRRAFTTSDADAGTPDHNRATFIALAMLLVDERAGDLAGAARAATGSCRAKSGQSADAAIATIRGRADWPKHWALSAALAAGANPRLAEAMGEWKELADTLNARPDGAIVDPTGFSFADLAADRSGYQIAQAAARPETAAAVADRLRSVTPEQLLPKTLTSREDGLSNAQFVQRYGGLGDTRFRTRVAEIDAILRTTGMLQGL